VITEDGRMHISNHKYSAGVYTPLDNLLNPWWLWLTEMLPRRLAPNLVTLAGFLPIVTSYALAWYASPDMATPPPRWLCFTMALSLFLYQTLDAMDGKQARRLGLSTPLGQLFDHGCDCMACLSHHSMAACVFMIGGGYWNLAGLAVLQTGFFMAQWQEHYTGVLRTSFGPVGVTETQYALIGLSAFAGIIGPDAVKAIMWRPVLGEAFRVCELFVMLWVIFNIVLMSTCFYMTMTPENHKKGQWVAPQMMKNHVVLDRTRALLDLVPVIVLNIVLTFGWHSDMIDNNTRLLLASAGLLFFYFTAQMIVFSMACMPFSAFQPSMIPFALLGFASKTAYLPFEMTAVKLTMVVHALALAFYVMCWIVTVINEIKGHLGIFIFFVDTKRDE